MSAIHAAAMLMFVACAAAGSHGQGSFFGSGIQWLRTHTRMRETEGFWTTSPLLAPQKKLSRQEAMEESLLKL